MILKIFKKFSYQCRNKTIFRLYIRNASNGFADFKVDFNAQFTSKPPIIRQRFSLLFIA